jgi:hypothetical protein
LTGRRRTTTEPTNMVTWSFLTENRKRIAILALLSFIALC